MNEDLRNIIRSIPNFPKKGIVFRDITTLLKDGRAFGRAVDQFAEHYRDARITTVVSTEARGFILGGAIAMKLGAGFVPARKPGKLPAATTKESYALEYGTDSVEIHIDAIKRGDRVLVHDDLLATGGTAGATCKLVDRLGGTVVGVCFLIELTFLHGREHLGNYDVYSLISYDSE